MKTIAKTLALITIMMISTAVLAGNNTLSTGKIHYNVRIHPPQDINGHPFTLANVYVVITDERNQPVAPAQLVSRGKLTYDFTETGAFTGTRIAELIYSNGTTQRLMCNPDAETRQFVTGGVYPFNLYPTFDKAATTED